MTDQLNKLILLKFLLILINVMTVHSIKERIIWFRPNRSELNSSETMDYSLNSSSDLSSTALNEKISNDLDVIEREIKVNVEKNDKTIWKDFTTDLSEEKVKPNKTKTKNSSEFESKTENGFNVYIERNLLNVQNISDQNGFYELSDSNKFVQNIKDISVDINSDKLNHSLIVSDKKLFQQSIDTNVNLKPIINKTINNKTDISTKKLNKTKNLKNNLLMKTTKTYTTTTATVNVNQVLKSVLPLKDTDRKYSKPNQSNENIYGNRNVIITVDTTDSSIATTYKSLTTNITNRSNSLIDRLKYLTAEEVNKNFNNQTNYLNNTVVNSVPGHQFNCSEFASGIEKSVSGDYLIINFKTEQNKLIDNLCIYLTNQTNVCTGSITSDNLCQPNKQLNCTEIECKLLLDYIDVNHRNLIIRFKCKTNQFGYCQNHTVDFSNKKPDSNHKLVVIITATILPIIACALCLIGFVYFRNNKSMKKFDCFGVKILKQMPYKSKSRKRRVDKMPTDASAGTAVINMEEVSQQQNKVLTKTVKFDDFSQYYQQNRADSGLKLAEEYEELKELSGKKRSMKISQFSINKAKNRFVNILPYDHSIVSLQLRNGVIGSDYINANFIPGFNTDKEYIASQGPLYSTVNDFFRMIIEHNVRIVVCLTQCIEKGRSKCEKYWPNNDDIDDIDEDSSHTTVPMLTFDDIDIELCDETIENDFVVRELKLKKDGSHHYVTQYHFTQWPDFGCPENPYSLINLIEVIRKKFQSISKTKTTESQQTFCSPILVHCSAGVGRSGTFIAVDKIMQMLEKRLNFEKICAKDISIDIFNCVTDMRKYRAHMVQTEDQYIFIYDCVKYLIDRYQKRSVKTTQQKDEIDSDFNKNIGSKIEQKSQQISCNNSNEDLFTGTEYTRQSSGESSENTEL